MTGSLTKKRRGNGSASSKGQAGAPQFRYLSAVAGLGGARGVSQSFWRSVAGRGICSDQIELEGGQYTGLEPSSFLVGRARQQYSSAGRAFVEGNIYDLPFASRGILTPPTRSRSGIFLGDLRLAAFELGRVLKERGHFLDHLPPIRPPMPPEKSPYVETRVEGRRLEGLVRAPVVVGFPRHPLPSMTLAELTDSLGAAGLRGPGNGSVPAPRKWPADGGSSFQSEAKSFPAG